MELFGIKIGTAELLAITIGVQWSLSALADSLPPPDSKSGKLYLTFHNLIHFFAANLSRIKSKELPPPPPDPPKVISIDRNVD